MLLDQRIMQLRALSGRTSASLPPSVWCPPCRATRQPSTVGVVSASYSSAAASTSQQSRRDEAARRAQELPILLQDIAQTAISNGPTGAVRALQAAQAVAVVGQEYLLSAQRGTPDEPQVVLRKLFNRLGTTFIKLGQFIASSPTLFPSEYVAEFQQTLDRAPPVPYSAIEAVLRRELGDKLDATFSYINPVPMATASVAQVHTAVLRANNKEVVLKVLKPGVEDIMKSDLSFVYLTMKILQYLNPALQRASLVDIVGDLRDAMTDEIDFVKEATNVETFRNYLSNSGLESIATAPYVYRQLSTQRVLVMERLEGTPLTDGEAIRRITGGRDPQQILINALNVWFGSVLQAPSFHADVHQGNLLVLPDGRVGFIDFGLVGKIPASTWPAIMAALAAFASEDTEQLARALATLQATDADVNMQAFSADLRQLFTEVSSLDPEVMVGISSGTVTASAAVADEQINRLALQLASVAEKHGIRFPRVFAVLFKALLYWNAYLRILAPTVDVFDDERIVLRDAIGPVEP